MKKNILKISGMHCASCSTLIEKSLQSQKGIKSISVNLATHTANVMYDESVLSIDKISEEIVHLGYKVVENIDDNQAARIYLHKFWLALVFTLPVAVTMFVSLPKLLRFDILVVIFATVVVFVSGWSFHVGFVRKLIKGQSNMDTLISISTIIAYGYSLYAVLQTYLFDNPIHFYHFLEGASFIITFILLGKYLETKSKGNASKAIQSLMKLQVKQALLLRGGKEVMVDIDDIHIDDVVVVKPGDKIPVDGLIVKGKSHIDESMLTGESIPVHKQIDSEVYSGTIVEDSVLHIRVIKEQEQTLLAKIIAVVEEAQASKPPIQHLVDKISSVFVPVILGIAVMAFVLHYTGVMTRVYDIMGWEIADITAKAILVLVSTIVIACPCAMGLATPVAITVASGTGAKKGILIKSGETLEKSKNIDVVVFDKTGTLTEGRPVVSDVISLQGHTKNKIGSLVASLSKYSNHPLSKAVVLLDKKTDIEISDFTEISGKGITGKVMDKTILFGNKKLLQDARISITQEVLSQVEDFQKQGKTVNYVAEGNNIIGLVALRDEPKRASINGVVSLKDMGINIIMISGDTEKTVAAIAKEVGIDSYHAEVYPEDKAKIIKELQQRGKRVAFVGDGINDAPALVQSDLGIAIGQGTDVAIESADMVLVHGDPSKVVVAIKLARKTYKIIKQNLFWAFGYNTILVPIAGLGLLMPRFASLAMSLSSVSVVLNSLRIKNT